MSRGKSINMDHRGKTVISARANSYIIRSLNALTDLGEATIEEIIDWMKKMGYKRQPGVHQLQNILRKAGVKHKMVRYRTLDRRGSVCYYNCAVWFIEEGDEIN